MEMTKEQLELITNQLATIKERSPFYAKKFEGIDVTDVRTQADFAWGLPCRKTPGRRQRRNTAHSL